MTYSDEPRIIRQRKLSRKQWILLFIGVLICLIFASALLIPIWHGHQRDHTPRGHHGGWEYMIEEAGVVAEVIRAPSYSDGDQLFVCLTRPQEHEHLEDYEVEVRQAGQWVSLPWNATFNLYGEGPLLPTRQDQRIRLRIGREGRWLWEGRVWAYSPELAGGGGHHHHHH